MPRTALRLTVALLLAVVAVGSAAAQDWSGRGRLNGSVTDESGKPIAGASVTLLLDGSSPDAGPPALQTDKKGKWSYLGLVGGSWAVRVAAEGYVISEGLIKVNEFQPNPIVALQLRKAEKSAAPESKANEVRAALEKGNELLERGRAAEARVEYEKALPLLETQYHPLVFRAVAQSYAAEKNWEAALGKLNEARAINADDAATVQLLAKTLADSGQIDPAIDTLRVYVEAHPEDTASLQLFIGILVANKRDADAATYSARLPAGAGIDPNTMLNMGINLYNDNKLAEALAQFEKVVVAQPDWADGYYYRGLTRIGLNDAAGAKADFEKVLAMSPNHPNAELCREFLKSL